MGKDRPLRDLQEGVSAPGDPLPRVGDGVLPGDGGAEEWGTYRAVDTPCWIARSTVNGAALNGLGMRRLRNLQSLCDARVLGRRRGHP